MDQRLDAPRMQAPSVERNLGAQLRPLLTSMRPRQWAKNLLVYLAFFFTVGEHGSKGLGREFHLFGDATLAFVLFCLLSGATYIFNDLLDLQTDRLHPTKRARPLASGALDTRFAATVAGGCIAVALGVGFAFDLGFGAMEAIYLALTLSYSLRLKHVVILDVMAIAGGFILRAAAGAQAINAPISPWLYIMTSLGALLLVLGKRRAELAALGDDGAKHRAVLDDYTLPFIDQLVAVVAPATVVAYALYTFTAKNLPADNSMMLTIPFVLYGVFRYLFVVRKGNLAGSPEEIFLTDLPMLINIVLWLGTAVGILVYAR